MYTEMIQTREKDNRELERCMRKTKKKDIADAGKATLLPTEVLHCPIHKCGHKM
jgi:hypothetical protein